MAAATGNWADLPEELLDRIAKRLTLYADRIRLRAVCVSWRSVLPETPNQLPRQFPLLMLFPFDPKQGGGATTTYEFFSIVENKSYFVEFPLEMSNKNFLPTSCHGWLIFEEKLSLGLFNPFTKARMELPSLNEYYPTGSKAHVTKVVLSASPSSSDFTKIVLLDFSCRLLISKFGDKRWTVIEHLAEYLDIYHDVIFYKQQIITLGFAGKVVIREVVLVDDGHGNPTTIKTSIKQILRPAGLDLRGVFHWQVLVESDNDDLFVITQSYDFSRIVCAVHKLDWQKNSSSRENIDDAEWSEVKSLGDRVYFPRLSPPSYFSARDFPECEGNCLYFHDADIDYAGVFSISCDYTLPLFDLADKQFKPWPVYPQGLFDRKRIWITPSPV